MTFKGQIKVFEFLMGFIFWMVHVMTQVSMKQIYTEKPRYCDLRCYDIPASDIKGSETDLTPL